LAPAGTTNWGPDQCKNDPDGSVSSDERLWLKDVAPGRYDVKLADKSGRECIVQNVELVTGRPYAFSIADQDLKNCTR
jgi:hypothetical protein